MLQGDSEPPHTGAQTNSETTPSQLRINSESTPSAVREVWRTGSWAVAEEGGNEWWQEVHKRVIFSMVINN